MFLPTGVALLLHISLQTFFLVAQKTKHEQVLKQISKTMMAVRTEKISMCF